ncbi:MAG: 4'-phosphopantetheinyl transferase superfamily protein [bacterium]|nr:4'-phosphopantetheinyl transferase superfamily protein [bacterium]
MLSRQVDVWVVDTSTIDTDEDLLSVAELGRALSLGSSCLLNRYLAARTWLRRQLGRYLGVPADEIEFEIGDHGKPQIVSPQTDLSFSLAYSGWAAVLAVGFRNDIGVDVEDVDGAVVNPTVVAKTLAAAERESYDSAIDPVRTFLRFWVRKESLAKATGLGVDRDIANTDVSGITPIEMGDFEIVDLNLGEHLVAAIAVPPGTLLNISLDDSIYASGSARSQLQPAAAVG